jgi:hypothetical protein
MAPFPDRLAKPRGRRGLRYIIRQAGSGPYEKGKYGLLRER